MKETFDILTLGFTQSAQKFWVHWKRTD